MRVAVTGASGGIGRVVVSTLDAAGIDVVRIDIRDTEDQPGTFFEADLSDHEDTGRAFEDIGATGSLQGVVAAAGVGAAQLGDGPLDIVPWTNWNDVVTANLHTMYHTLHHALPLLRIGAPSSVVAISSISGLVGSPGGVGTHGYAASKGAVISMIRAAAITYAPERIRFNTICPGAVDTKLLRAFFDAYPEQEAGVIARHPLGRVATPTDIANMALFLLSGESSFVTGTTIPVDGGFTAA